MYVVALMVMTGWCAALGNPATLPFVWLLKKALYRFVIRGEEEMLLEMFGESYRGYCLRVPRWIWWQGAPCSPNIVQQATNVHF